MAVVDYLSLRRVIWMVRARNVKNVSDWSVGLFDQQRTATISDSLIASFWDLSELSECEAERQAGAVSENYKCYYAPSRIASAIMLLHLVAFLEFLTSSDASLAPCRLVTALLAFLSSFST